MFVSSLSQPGSELSEPEKLETCVTASLINGRLRSASRLQTRVTDLDSIKERPETKVRY